MTADRMDGDAMDPAIARVLLIYREAVAQATYDALQELRALGVDGEDACALNDPDWRKRLRRRTRP